MTGSWGRSGVDVIWSKNLTAFRALWPIWEESFFSRWSRSSAKVVSCVRSCDSLPQTYCTMGQLERLSRPAPMVQSLQGFLLAEYRQRHSRLVSIQTLCGRTLELRFILEEYSSIQHWTQVAKTQTGVAGSDRTRQSCNTSNLKCCEYVSLGPIAMYHDRSIKVGKSSHE